MNMRRGLFRLWLVISGAWVALCVIGYFALVPGAPAVSSLMELRAEYPVYGDLPDATLAARVYDRFHSSSVLEALGGGCAKPVTVACVDAQLSGAAWGPLLDAFATAITPPAILLVLGAAFVWAGTGFRRESAT